MSGRGGRAPRLSAWQRQTLAIFEAEPARWFTPGEVAARMSTAIGGCSQTVASLIRHGRVERKVRSGRVYWRLRKP